MVVESGFGRRSTVAESGFGRRSTVAESGFGQILGRILKILGTYPENIGAYQVGLQHGC